MHAHVAGAVAEGQYRLSADLLRNLQHLVCQVFDKQPVRTHQHIVAGKHILDAVRISLVFRFQCGVGADDVLIPKNGCNPFPDTVPFDAITQVNIYQGMACVTVAPGNSKKKRL